MQECRARFVELAMLADLAVAHVAVLARAAALETLALPLAGRFDLLAHVSARAAVGARRKLFVRDGGHFDVEVNAIQQRPTDFAHVALDLRDAAMAIAAR